MQNPAHDVREVATLFTAAVTPDIQKASFERFWVPDAGFRHPLVSIAPSPNSREAVLGVFQWYRVMSPSIDIHINDVVYDADRNIIILDVTQTFHIRWSPFKPTPSRLLVRLTLREQDGLHYIATQEDFYHPDDFTSLLIPFFSPVIRALLSVGGVASNIGARIAQVGGVWRPGKRD